MQVATSVSSVTVYRNGALVVREGKGHGDVEVQGLPLLFASETLRVRPKAGAVAALEETVRLEAVPAPLPVDEGAAAKNRLDIMRVDDEMRALAELLEVLQTLSPVLPDPRSGVENPRDASAYVDLVAFAGERAADVVKERLALEQKRRELERERRRIEERRASSVPTQAPRVLRGARFVLDAGGDVDFALEYFVPAARWVPTYALHLDGGAKAKLVTAALVAQASGEDWKNARLSVCTADLSRDATLPVLSSWRIGRAQPAVLRAFRPLPTDLPALFHGYDHGPRRQPPAVDDKPVPPTTTPKPEPQASFDQLESGEVRSFEEERTNASVYPMSEALDAMDEGAAPMAELAKEAPYERAATLTRAGFVPPAASAAPMAPRGAAFGAPPAPQMAPKKSAPFLGGPGGGGRARRDDDDGRFVQAESDLPPRLRTAYMKMAGADEPMRGSLLPLDPIARLEWLLEAHDVDANGRALLRRAVDELRRAQVRLEQQPLPRGTSALLGTHFPAVLSAPASTDVPGDGTFYRVEVRVDEGNASVEHKAVPRESNDVWRVCRLEVGGAPLPAGPLVVYEDGAFKVNARLDGSGGGKPLDVNLGVDPDVRIFSRTVHVNQSEAGLVSSKSKVVHKIKMEVRSTRKEPAKVVLFDRLPVPADTVKDVVVSVVEEKPPIKKTNKDAHGNDVPGAFEWRVTVMPGDTQAIDFTYAIELPAKTELEGGNRRD